MQVIVVLRDGQNKVIERTSMESTLIPLSGETLVWTGASGVTSRYKVWEREFRHNRSDVPSVTLRVDEIVAEPE